MKTMKRIAALVLTVCILIGMPLSVGAANTATNEFKVVKVEELPSSQVTAELPAGRTVLVYFNNTPSDDALAITGYGKAVNIRIRATGEGLSGKDINGEIVASYGKNPIAVTFGNDKDNNLSAWRAAGYDTFKLAIRENGKGTDADKGFIKDFTDTNGVLLTAPDGTVNKYDEVNTAIGQASFVVTKVEELPDSQATAELPAGRTVLVYFNNTPSDDALAITGYGKAVNIRMRATGAGLSGKDINGEIVASYGKNPIAVTFGNDKDNNFPAWRTAGYDTFKLAIRENNSGTDADKGYIKGFTDQDGTLLTAPDGTVNKYDEVLTSVERGAFSVIKVEELPATQATDELPAGRTVLVYFSSTPSDDALAITGYGKAVNIRMRATGAGLSGKDVNGEIVASYGKNPIAVTFGNDKDNNLPAWREAGYDTFKLAIRENNSGTDADKGYIKGFTDEYGSLLIAADGTVNKYDEVLTTIEGEPFAVTKVEELPASQATAELPAGRTVLVYFNNTPSDAALSNTGYGKTVNIRIRATGEGLSGKDINGEIVASYGKNPIAVTFGNATDNLNTWREAGYDTFKLAIRENNSGTDADKGYIKGFTDLDNKLLTAPDGTVNKFDEVVTAIGKAAFIVTKVEELPASQATGELLSGRTLLVYFNSAISEEALANTGYGKAVNIRFRATGDGLATKDLNGEIVASYGTNPIAVTFGNTTDNNFPAMRTAGYDKFVLAIRENNSGTDADKGYIKGFTDINGAPLTAPDGTVKNWDEVVTPIDASPFAVTKVEKLSKVQETEEMPASRTVLAYFNFMLSEETLSTTGLNKAVNIRVRATGNGVPTKEMNAEIVASYGRNPIAVVFGDDTENNFDALSAAGYDTFTLVICENDTGTDADKGFIKGFTDINGGMLAEVTNGDDVACEEVAVPVVIHLHIDSVVAISDIEAIITFSAPVEIVDDPFGAARLFTSAGKLVWKTPDGEYVDTSSIDGVKNSPMQWSLKYEWNNVEHTQLKCVITGGKEGMANFTDFVSYDWEALIPGSYLVFGFEEKNATAVGGNGYVDNIHLASDPSVKLYATKPGIGTNYDGAYCKLALDYTPQTITASAKVLNDMQIRITFSQPVAIKANPYMGIRFVENGKLLWFGDDYNQTPATFNGTWEWVEGSKTAIIWTMSGGNALGANNISDIINRRGAVDSVGDSKLTICIEEANGDDFIKYGSNGRVDNITSLDGKNHLKATVAASDGCYMDLKADFLKKDSTVDLLSAVAVDDQTIELTFSEAVILDDTAEALSMMLRYVNTKGNSDVLANGKTANFKGTWEYKDENKNVLIWKLKSNNAESLTDIFNFNGRLEWNKGSRIVFIVSNTDDYVPYSARIRGITDLSGYNSLNARGTETPEVHLDVQIAYDLPAAEVDTETKVTVEYITNYLPYLIAVGACVLVCVVVVIVVATRRKKEEK